MKKIVLKATALAIGALVGGVAFASVNLDTGVTTGTFAKELDFSATAITGAKTISSKLGFGVSGGQDRYIRVDLVGAKLAAAAAGANVTNTTLAFANAIVVQGGAVNDTYVIYQVTAAGAGHAASDAITVALPNLKVTNGNTASVNTTFTLYETAVAAVQNLPNTNLYQASGALLKFAPGLSFALTTNTTTADVSQSFKKFTAATTTGATPATADTKTARIGSFAYGTVAGVKIADGATDVTLTDLVTAATKLTFTGNFGATAVNGVYVDNNDACVTVNAATVNAGKTSADYTVGTTATTANLCYVVTGSTAVPAQTVNAALDLTAAAGSSAADIAAAAIGNIDRDGTELQAPFATIHGDYTSRIVLTSQHSADAAVEAVAILEDGSTCAAGTAIPNLKAGKQLFVDVASICPSITATTGGTTRLAVKLTIAAPSNSISGVYNQYRKGDSAAAAGSFASKTSDLTSYPLLRPGTN